MLRVIFFMRGGCCGGAGNGDVGGVRACLQFILDAVANAACLLPPPQAFIFQININKISILTFILSTNFPPKSPKGL